MFLFSLAEVVFVHLKLALMILVYLELFLKEKKMFEA